MDWTAILTQLLEIAAALAVAPLFMGWVTQCRAWLQNRTAPSLWLPYRAIHKLFHKDAVLAQDASPLFRAAPYVVFGTMVVAAAIIPSMSTLPLTPAADAIALVGLFATARVFMALAAMDVGTAFGTLGARREMMVGFLAEPALLMVIFVASLISATTALPVISGRLATQAIGLYPSLAFTAVAFTLVLLAENARIPVDNPATHLELTMIHEAMLLEYSARHLALMEWAAALKLFNYACIGFALFVPWGIATGEAGPLALLLSIPLLAAQARIRGSWDRAHRDAVGEAARVPRTGVPRDRLPVRGAGDARSPAARSLTMTVPGWDLQLLNLFAALLLLLSFAMLSQRRIVSLVNLLALQGAVLCAATLLLAWRTGQGHLYLSAALTLGLKVVGLPWLLHRLIRRLEVYWETEPLINAAGTMMVGLLIVIFSFGLAQPIAELASTTTRSALGIAVSVILLAFLMMITRRKALSQVIGFLSMENGLFFGAMSATYGMPMVVELGVALDVLVAMLVLGVFFFQIREQFDSLDLHHLESLRER